MFTQIFDSSIADDYQVRYLFEDLCKLADVEGVVDMTPEAIAARTRVPLNIVKECLTKLEAPDPRSRSPLEEGRRIVRIDSHRDWGWRIVNYEHYRELRDDDARRSYFRDYMREYRAKKKKKPVINSKQKLNAVNRGQPQSTQAEAEAEAEAEVQVHTPISTGNPMGGHNAPDRGGVSETVQEKAKFEVDTRFRALKAWIEPFFKRPTARITDAEEVRLMAEVSRRPDIKIEIQLIDGLFRGLEDKSKFPRSVVRLLQSWQQKVDEARTCKTPVAAAEDRELREIQKPL